MTLVIFLIGIWSLSFFIARMLRADMQRMMGEQQFSSASLLAAKVDKEIGARLSALDNIAGRVTSAMMGHPATLQASLENRPILQSLFNGGVMVVGRDGTAIADVPLSIGRIGVNYLDREYIVTTLKEGKTTIGRPVMGKKLPAPLFSMAAPIRDVEGAVIGALVGVTDLGKPNFLSEITEGRYGKTGGYTVVARQYRLIVTASDKNRVMEKLPDPGVIPEIDRLMKGDEGFAVYVNPRGVEVLASAKNIPLAGWQMGVLLPTEEAFAPIRTMQQRMMLATMLMSVLAGGLTWWFTWWMLRHQLAPMLAATRAIDRLSETFTARQLLPVTSQDEIGELIGAFNRMLEALGQREEALQESEFRWKFAIEGSGDGLWDWNVPQSTVFFSSRWKEMLGFAPDEIGSGLDEWSKRLHPDDLARVMADVQAHLAGKMTVYVNEHRVRCKDGSYKWILDRGLVVERDAANNPLRMIGTHTDITERKQAEDEIRRLNADLERRILERTADLEAANRSLAVAKARAEAANIAKSAFLANMSHEIRTPMNGILGMVDILRREGINSKQAQRFDTIDASAQHLLSVINDVLDISKIEAGKFVLEETPVVVSSLMANVSSILSERAKAKGIRLLIETGHLPHNLLGDPTRLQQALLNYATNAVKFTEQGTVTLRALKQEETVDSVRLRFEVADTGIGIDPEAMSRLFRTFEQADNSMNRKYGGTGLGLAITKRLAELMGGEVGADSTPGAGSTFWFTVKLTKSGETAEAATATAVDAEAEIRRRYAGQRILVTDDEPVNREVAVMQLEAVDLVVDTAEDGAEAVALATKNSYAAIFMDMQMPRLNGLEATQAIRQLPGHRNTPIIAMTANAFAEDKERCFKAGMSDFLIKPFKPDELFAILLCALSRRDR